MNKENDNLKFRITIGVLLIVVGLGIIFGRYFMMKKSEAYERITFEVSNMPTEVEQEENNGNDTSDEKLNDTVVVEEKQVYVNKANYIGRLEIPKIRLVKGFVSKDSSSNNVNKNIAIMKPSDYPDVDKGNFILAGHNGTGWNSYFRNLYKLKVGDMAYVYYNGVKYTYKITRIYQQNKSGSVMIYRNNDKNTLTLITCTKGDKKSQTVFICELENKENI